MAKSYFIKEILYTLQGEGFHSGRPAVFCRFSGCNLWTGKEQDRKNAICSFCDTDFRGTDGENGGVYDSPESVVNAIVSCWPKGVQGIFVVLTGGEPMLQVDDKLLEAMHNAGIEVSIETNGTIPVLPDMDWITVSPKANTELLQTFGDELKLVYPQQMITPDMYVHLNFEHFYLQPMDGPRALQNTSLALQYCLGFPQWKLSLQNHKILDIR